MITWDDLPIEIQNRMLECQEEQGNPKNPEVFKIKIGVERTEGGFNWFSTRESASFWLKVLIRQKIEIFYEKYPKNDICDKIDKILTKLEKYDNLE